MMNSEKYPLNYQEIVEEIKPSGAFLVGGAVRDLLLDKKIHDLDFALPGDTLLYAKRVADIFQGDYYVLDKIRKSARVILIGSDQNRLMVDFTQFQGDTIQQDLQSRDFTITSMAMDLNQDHRLIDPFQGVRDLRERLVRSTTDHSLRDDPLRCIRAVRMAAQLNFRILSETKGQIRESVRYISEISPERIRDEIFKLLAGPNQSAALDTLRVLGIYSQLFSDQLTEGRAKTFRKLEELWNRLLIEYDQDTAANWAYGLYVHRLGRYRNDLQGHLDDEPVLGRSVYQLGFLLPLILKTNGEGEGDLEMRSAVDHSLAVLALSNLEIDRICKALEGAVHFRELVHQRKKVEPIEVYRYFRNYQNAGIEGVFLGLANFLAAHELSLQESGWERVLDTARSLLEGWWERKAEWVDPPNLLNGDDLQKELGLEPGPRIGFLLEALREGQVQKGIDDRESALHYLQAVHQGKNDRQ